MSRYLEKNITLTETQKCKNFQLCVILENKNAFQ